MKIRGMTTGTLSRAILVGGASMAAALLYWALAQPSTPPIASLFPPGALVYVEAKDFSALAADWDRSAEKTAWLKSANHDAFSRSELFLKLAQEQSDFAAAAGVPPDYALLKSVAGANSALAIYNIHNMALLYVTHLAAARAFDTALWKTRGTYQTRKAGGVDFYVKEDRKTQRVAAFAYTGDLLMLGTSEDLIAGALTLLASRNSSSRTPSLASEKWFADATGAAQSGPGELRLVHNLDKLEQTPQFRSHWVQRNARDLREYAAGIADLERAGGEMRERRVLLRTNPVNPVSDESAAGQLLAAIPDDAGFYRATLHPTLEQTEKAIEEKIFSAIASPKPRNDFAPLVEIEQTSGSEQDLETRIDEPPLSDDRAARAFAPIRERISTANLQAMVEISSTRTDADQVFIGAQSAIAVLGATDWNPSEIRAALSSAAGALWSNRDLGAGWRAGSNAGVSELDGLGRVAIAIEGRWLIVGNSPELVGAVLARRSRAPVAGAVYEAGWRHARELPNFERMMRLIDFPQLQATGPGDQTQGREPMFYSENIASFGRVLQRVQSATVTVHDAGSMLRESIIYRLAP
jgi:hypothetical protein